MYCDCGTCLIPSEEEARRLNKERFDVLTLPYLQFQKEEHSGELGMVYLKITGHTIKPKNL